MKTNHVLSLLFLFLFTFSCTDIDDNNEAEFIDLDGPELYDVRWIDNPSIDNDPNGDILNGSNHTISIESGFQFSMSIKDASDIESGIVYMLVNDDPAIREDIIYDGTEFGYKEGTFNFVHRVDQFWIGPGDFYTLQAGDKIHFYAEFADEIDNMTTFSWTADLVE